MVGTCNGCCGAAFSPMVVGTCTTSKRETGTLIKRRILNSQYYDDNNKKNIVPSSILKNVLKQRQVIWIEGSSRHQESQRPDACCHIKHAIRTQIVLYDSWV